MFIYFPISKVQVLFEFFTSSLYNSSKEVFVGIGIGTLGLKDPSISGDIKLSIWLGLP
jgi:hypothetical protein